jgi:predicted RNase H-like HicB family nuclease
MKAKQSGQIGAQIAVADITVTPTIHKDGDWYAAVCPEVPEANGQGRTPEKSVEDLKQGILSILQDRQADAVKNGHYASESA